jgi:hypothetical protein
MDAKHDTQRMRFSFYAEEEEQASDNAAAFEVLGGSVMVLIGLAGAEESGGWSLALTVRGLDHFQAALRGQPTLARQAFEAAFGEDPTEGRFTDIMSDLFAGATASTGAALRSGPALADDSQDVSSQNLDSLTGSVGRSGRRVLAFGHGTRPRLIADGLVYHALNLGNHRADAFHHPDDRLAFLDALARTQSR